MILWPLIILALVTMTLLKIMDDCISCHYAIYESLMSTIELGVFSRYYQAIRIMKATKTSTMILQAIRINWNVSVMLALSLLIHKLLKFFSMNVRYGHYSTHKILFI